MILMSNKAKRFMDTVARRGVDEVYIDDIKYSLGMEGM